MRPILSPVKSDVKEGQTLIRVSIRVSIDTGERVDLEREYVSVWEFILSFRNIRCRISRQNRRCKRI